MRAGGGVPTQPLQSPPSGAPRSRPTVPPQTREPAGRGPAAGSAGTGRAPRAERGAWSVECAFLRGDRQSPSLRAVVSAVNGTKGPRKTDKAGHPPPGTEAERGAGRLSDVHPHERAPVSVAAGGHERSSEMLLGSPGNGVGGERETSSRRPCDEACLPADRGRLTSHPSFYQRGMRL